MYERSYGSKYDESRDMSRTEVARLIRADVKAARKNGVIPEWVNVSCRTSYYSMGGSIDMTVHFDERLWEQCDGFAPDSKHEYAPGLYSGTACAHYGNRHGVHDDHERLNDLGRHVVGTVQAIHWSYNYDGSDSQVDYFDVRYAGSVTAENRFSADFWKHDKERKAQRRAARAARSAA